jgi:hypothetical protein
LGPTAQPETAKTNARMKTRIEENPRWRLFILPDCRAWKM